MLWWTLYWLPTAVCSVHPRNFLVYVLLFILAVCCYTLYGSSRASSVCKLQSVEHVEGIAVEGTQYKVGAFAAARRCTWYLAKVSRLHHLASVGGGFLSWTQDLHAVMQDWLTPNRAELWERCAERRLDFNAAETLAMLSPSTPVDALVACLARYSSSLEAVRCQAHQPVLPVAPHE